MAYIKTIWKKRVGADLSRFAKYQETSKSVVLNNTPNHISEPGTPFSEENMNKIEEGIFDAHETIAAEEQARAQGDAETLAAAKIYAGDQVGNHNTDEGAHGDIREKISELEDVDSGMYGMIADEESARANGDEAALAAAKTYTDGRISAEAQARIQGDEDALAAAKAYTDQTILATNDWLPPVMTADNLPVTGLLNTRNYLCKVVADGGDSGVYQAVAGWDAAPVWELFNDDVDLVCEPELEAAVYNHNTDEEAHGDIREDITNLENALETLEEEAVKHDGLGELIPPFVAAGVDGHDESETAHEELFNAKIDSGRIGEPDGVAGLDENGKIPLEQLPDEVAGDLSGIFGELALKVSKSDVLNIFYPIGSIYESVSDQSPAEFMGGTWTVWGSGRVSVGVDTAQAEFNAVEKTGGAKTHTLIKTEIPGHTHSTPNHTHPNTSHTHSFSNPKGVAAGSNWLGHIPANGTEHTICTLSIGSATVTTPNGGAGTSGSEGGGGAHNNLQPYITSYKFKRTG